MKRKPVSSSMIAEIGYETSNQILEILFTSGELYQYFDVPSEEHRGLMQADTHGQYFNEHIKDVYNYVRL